MNKIVLTMASLRMMSGSMEIIAAIVMLRLATVEKALLVNSTLALVGPLVLLATTTIGLVGIAEKLSYGKMLWVIAGVSCLFIGILKSNRSYFFLLSIEMNIEDWTTWRDVSLCTIRSCTFFLRRFGFYSPVCRRTYKLALRKLG